MLFPRSFQIINPISYDNWSQNLLEMKNEFVNFNIILKNSFDLRSGKRKNIDIGLCQNIIVNLRELRRYVMYAGGWLVYEKVALPSNVLKHVKYEDELFEKAIDEVDLLIEYSKSNSKESIDFGSLTASIDEVIIDIKKEMYNRNNFFNK